MMLLLVIPLLSQVSALSLGYTHAIHLCRVENEVRGEMAVKLVDLLLNSQK